MPWKLLLLALGGIAVGIVVALLLFRWIFGQVVSAALRRLFGLGEK